MWHFYQDGGNPISQHLYVGSAYVTQPIGYGLIYIVAGEMFYNDMGVVVHEVGILLGCLKVDVINKPHKRLPLC